jgi:hypothetical protein
VTLGVVVAVVAVAGCGGAMLGGGAFELAPTG